MGRLWINNGKLVTDNNKIIECDSCPCHTIIVNAVNDCGLSPSSGVFVGYLDGTYRVTYLSGAARTRNDQPWNDRAPNPAQAMYIDLSIAPGYSLNFNGYPTAIDAENAYTGTYQDYVFDGSKAIYMWYADGNCGDNQGSISYSVIKIA